MIIHQTNSDIKLGGDRNATIQLNVTEITVMCNAMLLYSKEYPNNESVAKLHKDMYILMSLIKDGGFDSVAIGYLGKLQEDIDKCDA